LSFEIKDGMFTVGIDDSSHKKGDKSCELFFVFCRGRYIERISHFPIDVDGFDSTDMIIKILKPNPDLYTLITIHGITVGGFNLIDLQTVYDQLKKPILAITENKPHGRAIFEAIAQLPNLDKRKEIIQHAGPMFTYSSKFGTNDVFYYIKGITEDTAKRFLAKFAFRAKLPEPVLLSHKIACGFQQPNLIAQKNNEKN
jgi:endonuclease V-like protein UPF0215 family